jgi:cell division protein FtsI (penicillin-binding protein 3)
VAPDERRAVEPALARNRCVEDVYEPGSTFKPFVWAAAKSRGLLPDAEVLRQSENIYRTPYGRSVEDVTFKTELTWDDVLKYSSNIGMVQAGERLTFEQARNTIRALGFGSAAGTGLPGETPGLVTSARNWTAYTQTSISMGYEVGVTPVQMVRAFSVFARNGGLAGTLPSVRLTAAGPADRPGRTGEPVIAERVYDPAVAVRTRQPLKTVADRLDDLMKRHFKGDPEPSYVMFGKSGTSKIAAVPPKGKLRPRGAPGYFEKQYTTSFLAGAPLEEPRIVVLVVIDDPGPELVRTLRYYGSWTAGPVVRRVTERTLRYLGVPPDRAETDVVAAADGMRD